MSSDLCVVFDVDDTLYLERDYAVSGFREVGRWATRWLSITDFDARCIDLFDAGRRGRIFDEALLACGCQPVPELIAGMLAIYRGHEPQIAMLPDAAQAVALIREKWPIAIITDGPVISQSRKCEALGLLSLANPVVLTGAMGETFHKPGRGAFEYVAGQIGAKRYVYVADNPSKDFTAPGQLGWRSVRIRREGGIHAGKPSDSPVPDFELRDCLELYRLLSGLQ